MPSGHAPGNKEALAAIAAISGKSIAEVAERFRSEMSGDTTAAGREEVLEALHALIRRTQLAPISFDIKQPLIEALTARLEDPPPLGRADVAAWHTLTRSFPLDVVEIRSTPIVLPAMPNAQENAWQAVLDFEENLAVHWCLIGGQMVTLVCAEHGYTIHRPTYDADIVLGVWMERDALKDASRLLDQGGFTEDPTHDGYGYRYRRGNASIDVLLPEGISTQQNVPTTMTGRRGLEVSGGNQALIRAEKVAVRLGNRIGHVRRPNLLGALISKAAASLVDSRDTDRHRDDMAVLGQIALMTGQFRSMARMTHATDRKRLRRALEEMPDTHSSWRLINDPVEVRAALVRLATVNRRSPG